MSLTTANQRLRGAARPRRVDSWRIWVLIALFTLFGGYNLFTVFKLQVLQHGALSAKAESRIKWKDTILPRRGLIYDAQGQILAGNTTANDVYVDVTHQDTDDDLHHIADLLAPVLGQQPQDLYDRIKQAKENDGINIRVAVRVSEDTSQKVRDLRERYDDLTYVVTLDPQPLRRYPATGPDGKSTLAASVLGFSDYENVGHYGVEEYYNEQLAGVPGWIDAERDASGRPLVLEEPKMQAAVDGSNVTLTIDSAVQYLAERELKKSLEEFKAESGYVVVQDPSTGAILAMANYPAFDANGFNTETNYERFKNPMVNNVREPGSTMKVLTYSSAIDAGAVMSSTTFYGTACIVRYGWNICNATHREYGYQTMTEGLGRSDNIASMYAAEQLGEEGFFDYVRNFGIGKRTGIDLAGEVAGLIAYPGDENYSPVNLYTNSFGQGVATTPIQLINAVSAVANGGTLLKPYVMKEISKNGEVVERNERTEVRRVIKPETAHDIAEMLALGVENGLVARFAHVPGYRVSVKTGTAQLAADGGYTGDGSFASAMGFGPTHDARFTLYIGLLNPRSSQWGENTASVAWGRLAKELLLYMNVRPTEPLPTPTATP
jgi:cell division protein FtsI/penicillin-binding protein 2